MCAVEMSQLQVTGTRNPEINYGCYAREQHHMAKACAYLCHWCLGIDGFGNPASVKYNMI